ncbi:GWxTD domain-containing protein [candidate division WOR-3 bacterium]|nr:GWxTD domain-containing protein [candidate division WOR-3 bacterium]
MGILLLIIPFQISLDIARFKAENNLNLCEVYISIPYSDLSYKEEKGILKSTFKIRLNIKSPESKTLSRVWDRISYINSYEQAKSRELHALDKLDLFLESGKYDLELEILGNGIAKRARKSFEIIDFDTSFSLSDIEFATKIESAEEGKFIKNGLQIIPHPQAIFGKRYSILYIYAEIYNLKKDSPYKVDYLIFNTSGKIVKKLPAKSSIPKASDIAETGGINIITLKEGTYIFKLQITQDNKTIQKERPFYIVKGLKNREEFKLTAEELKYYDLIQYVATSKELEFYNNLSEEAKPNFLVSFWRKVGKSLLNTLISRIKYADAHFPSINELGRDSAKGRIWIKYGKPDEIESYSADPSYRACDKWLYYSKGGMTFIFVDKSSCGRYTLVWSNTKEEQTDPNYKKWVNPELLE